MSDGPDPEGRDHEPSEKRIKEALDRGDAPIAQDQTLLGALFAIYVALNVIRIVVTPERVVSIGAFFERCGDISVARGAEALGLFKTLGVGVAGGWLAIVAALASVSFVVGTLPQRPRAAWRRITVDSARLNPLMGFNRLFGRSALVSFGKAMAKSGFAFLAAGAATGGFARRLGNGVSRETGAVAADIMAAAEQIALSVVAIVGCFAILDLVTAQFVWKRKLRMTRQEVKDELKQSDGDPHVKMRMRSIALDRARKRMLSDVKSATMVVTNPTHYAVALRYVREQGGAPIVVAKGQELIALKIRAEAEQRDIPIVEQPQLARALYRSVEIGQIIPPEFYRAVAEIVNFLSVRETYARPSP